MICMSNINSSKGQTLIIVILTLIIALTIGLSLASRTITNLRLSRQGEESSKAFQAAEAGVEEILQSSPGCTPGTVCSLQTLQNNTSYQTKVSYPSGTAIMLNGGELVDQDTGIDVWLSTYPDFTTPVSTTLTVYWATNNLTRCTRDTNDATSDLLIRPAMEVIILSGSKLAPTMDKYLLETNGCSSRIANSEAPGGANSNPGGFGVGFQNSKSITVVNGLIARVIPIFNSTKVVVTSTNALPRQGTVIESTGKAANTVRKVQYFASYPQVPFEIFPYSLISQ